jgi:hypothetical protein
MIADYLPTQDRYNFSKISKEFYQLLWTPIDPDQLFSDIIYLMQSESYLCFGCHPSNFVVSNFIFTLSNENQDDPVFNQDTILFGFCYHQCYLYLKFKKDTIGESPFLPCQIEKLEIIKQYGYNLESVHKNEMTWCKPIHFDLDLFHQNFLLILRLTNATYYESIGNEILGYFEPMDSIIHRILTDIKKSKIYLPPVGISYFTIYCKTFDRYENEHHDVKEIQESKYEKISLRIYDLIRVIDDNRFSDLVKLIK